MRARAAALCVLLAACGGARLQAGQVIERGNVICRDAADRIRDLPTAAPGDDADRRRYLSDVIQAQDTTALSLAALALRAPEEMRASMDALVAAFRAGNAGLSEALAADELGDDRAFRRARARTGESRALFDQLASRLRMTACVARA